MLTLEELCDLRDRLIMDSNYSQKEQEFLYGVFQDAVLKAR